MSHPPRSRFFLLLPNQRKVELHRVALSVGAEGSDYYLATDDYESIRNAGRERGRE
jgi:hypothetical protein